MLRPFPHFLDFFSSFNVFSLLRLCWFLFSFPKFYDGDNHFLVIVTLEQFDNCRKNKTKKESLLPIWDLEAPRCLVRRVFSWPRFLLLPLVVLSSHVIPVAFLSPLINVPNWLLLFLWPRREPERNEIRSSPFFSFFENVQSHGDQVGSWWWWSYNDDIPFH